MTSPQIMRLTNFPHQTGWRIIKRVETLLGDELKLFRNKQAFSHIHVANQNIFIYFAVEKK